MESEIKRMFAKITLLEKEFVILRKGYVIVNKRYTAALHGLSSLTQNVGAG